MRSSAAVLDSSFTQVRSVLSDAVTRLLRPRRITMRLPSFPGLDPVVVEASATTAPFAREMNQDDGVTGHHPVVHRDAMREGVGECVCDGSLHLKKESVTLLRLWGELDSVALTLYTCADGPPHLLIDLQEIDAAVPISNCCFQVRHIKLV